MTQASMNAKLIISLSLDGDEPIQVGTTDMVIPVDLNGNVAIDLESAIRDALNGTVKCANHKPVQHRDGKPPWCNTCREFGTNGGGYLPCVVENRSGRTEPILTPEQWDKHNEGHPKN